LAGCQAGPAESPAGRAVPPPDSVRLVERDIEAPEVFQVEDRALWDGRPSLGGVWVAAPDVREPERVIIRNPATGKFVIGALFKRERANPGPALQLSSDAAAALDILAGAPTVIDVVALRREEVTDPVAAPEAVAPAAEDVAIVAAGTEEILRLPEAEGASEAEQVARLPEVEPRAEPRRSGFFGRLFGRGRATAEATQEPIHTPVDPSEGTASAAVATTALPATERQSAAPRETLDRAYVQIGIFSVEQNARNTATALSGAGIVPTVLEEDSSGKTFWRVVVGPATTASDRAAVLRTARELGFADAFAVRS
jgi:cell division septation protein DedD